MSEDGLDLTPEERRVLAAGLASMQPHPSLYREETGKLWSLAWGIVLGLCGWVLLGIMVLGVVGLLGVFAI